MRNTAKLFICNHPAGLMLYKNLIKIIKKYDQDAKIILFKVNHPYFAKFDFEPYREYFDEIVGFESISYKRNFWSGLRKIFIFQKKLKKIMADSLSNFEQIDLFLDDSAWLPANILLFNLSQMRDVKNIIRFSQGVLDGPHAKTDKLKTFFCRLYSLPLKCYNVRVISTLGGQFLDFSYTDNVPGKTIKIINPTADPGKFEEENVLPYPIIRESQRVQKRDMVIIFGDATLDKLWGEYLPDNKTFVEKLASFFSALERKYPDCTLYYKPHPGDGKMVMQGIDIRKYNFFDNKVNAQAIFDKYQERVKAVYTFSSTSVVIGSFFGIPSYTFYRYLCNRAGIDKFDNLLDQESTKSRFLFHLSDSNEIGKIDNLESVNCYVDLENVDDKYLKVLNI